MWTLLFGTALAWTPVGPGVDRDQWIEPGPNRVSAVRVDLCRRGVALRATTSGERGARTSSWAAARGVVAASNGGFYLGGFAPDGGAVGAGTVWPDAFDATYRGWIGFGPRGFVHQPAGTVSWPPPDWIDDAVNGDATLVVHGQPTVCNCSGRAPRTAVGWTADRRTLYLVTVDGRSSSSVGMTIDELAVRMAAFGVDGAMNLDGGGSSTLWTAATGVMNVPSDGSERTVANHLGVYADDTGLSRHCPTGWSAQYVGSSFPGGTTLRAEVGQVLSGTVTLFNDGTETWVPALTTLAPLPRDQPHPLREGWVADNRIVRVTETTDPGETGAFPFSLRVPDTPGTSRFEFSLVQEGVRWFGDSWGPEDGHFWFSVEALPVPAWRADLATDLPATVVTTPGAQVQGLLTLTNTGTETWPAGIVRLGTTEPRDHAGLFFHPSWLGVNRVVAVPGAVAPGATVTVPYTLQAPQTVGRYTESFGLVAELITWFSEDGGPADDVLTVTLDVGDPDPDGDGLTSDDEVARGTDPLLADTDADGLTDGDEVARGTDPLLAEPFSVLLPASWTAGTTASVDVVGAPPNRTVHLLASSTLGATRIPGCTTTAPVVRPTVLATPTTDADGRARVDLLAPATVAGRTGHLVAVDLDDCLATPAASVAFDP